MPTIKLKEPRFLKNFLLVKYRRTISPKSRARNSRKKTRVMRGGGNNISQLSARVGNLTLEDAQQHESNKREAAKRLKLGLSSLYRKIEELGIDL